MNENLRESLSAAADGEASELEMQRLLRDSNDPQLRATWQRMHLAHDVLHDSAAVSGLPGTDFASNVLAAIDADRAQQPGFFSRALKPVASLAVAASVAAVVVVGAGGSQLLSGTDPYAPSSVLSGAVSAVGLVNNMGATPVRASYGNQPVPAARPAVQDQYRELARQQMQRYLPKHVEQASLNAPNGLVPYTRARVVER